MNLFEIKKQQEKALREVELNKAAFKLGVILRTAWTILKPVLIWTAVFFLIGAYFITAAVVQGVFGKRR